jgi:hypothetical protein
VIWSDDAGRGGIRFSGLPESSRQILKEWLFANLLIACSNHAARTEQLAQRKHDEENLPEPAPVTKTPNVVPMPDQSEALSSVEAVRSEVGAIGDDIDAVLQLITERALNLTEASGAALAFLTDGQMICRARAGEPAPPLGAPVDVKRGLSGECVRSGRLVSCEVTENDPRIGPEIGRALGIGSLIAAPIMSDFRVVGLLEVFSPYPHSFTKADAMVLDRLVEMIPKSIREKAQSENIQSEKTQPETLGPEAVSGGSQPPASEFDSIHATREALWEQETEVPEQVSQHVPEQSISEQLLEHVPEAAPTAPSRLRYRALLGLTIAVVVMVLGYLVGPMIGKRNSSQASQRSLAQAASTSGQSATDHSSSDRRPSDQRPSVQRAQAKSLADLQKLADQGNADAQWQMGIRYHNGENVPHDDAQAMQWFLRAAEQGNVAAQSALGAYYWAGRGVPEDLSKAYFWSAIALAQ